MSASLVRKLSIVREDEPEVRTREGASARVRSEPDGDVLEVRDGRGRLVLEHREAERRTVILAAEGDLELAAARGSIRLSARDDVSISGKSGRIAIEDLRFESRTITTVAERVRQTAGAVETSAGRIVERARNVYRDVEELAQTRAGRIRHVAATTYQLLARRARMKAEEEVAIDGERIHLG